MNKRFDLVLRIFLVCSVLVDGLAIVQLFSWSTLPTVDKFFFVSSAVLVLFAFYVILLLRVPEPVVHPVVVDEELVALREELKNVPPTPEPVFQPKAEREKEFHRLETDISMYERPRDVDFENRNIIKPVDFREEKEDDNQYRGVF